MEFIKNIFSFLFSFYPSKRLSEYYGLIREILAESDNNIKKKIDSYYNLNVIPSYIYYAYEKGKDTNDIRKILKVDLYYLEKNMAVYFLWNVIRIITICFFIFLLPISILSLILNHLFLTFFFVVVLIGCFLIGSESIKAIRKYLKLISYFSIEKDVLDEIINNRLDSDKDEKIFVKENIKKNTN